MKLQRLLKLYVTCLILTYASYQNILPQRALLGQFFLFSLCISNSKWGLQFVVTECWFCFLCLGHIPVWNTVYKTHIILVLINILKFFQKTCFSVSKLQFCYYPLVIMKSNTIFTIYIKLCLRKVYYPRIEVLSLI